MLTEEFSLDENLFRSVSDVQWDYTEDKPSTAVFKDSFGASFDRQGERSIEEACATMVEKFFETKAIIYLSVRDCLLAGSKPVYKPEPDNIYHCILIRPDANLKLSDSTRKKLKVYSNTCFKLIE